jgi:hypothetical protein
MVSPVTRAPRSPAAYSAKPPQPHPISSRCWSGTAPIRSSTLAYLRRCAVASPSAVLSKIAEE